MTTASSASNDARLRRHWRRVPPMARWHVPFHSSCWRHVLRRSYIRLDGKKSPKIEVPHAVLPIPSSPPARSNDADCPTILAEFLSPPIPDSRRGWSQESWSQSVRPCLRPPCSPCP